MLIKVINTLNDMETEANNTSKPNVRKCPYCGELLPPLTNVCPSCGQIVENQNGDNDVSSIMSEIDDVCARISGTSIRIYDYILLLIPIIYIVWIIVVFVKIAKSNRLYNEFCSLRAKAQTLYGDNHRFRTYLSSKTTEMENLKSKSKTSHIIIYIIIVVDVLLLGVSLAG